MAQSKQDSILMDFFQYLINQDDINYKNIDSFIEQSGLYLFTNDNSQFCLSTESDCSVGLYPTIMTPFFEDKKSLDDWCFKNLNKISSIFLDDGDYVDTKQLPWFNEMLEK